MNTVILKDISKVGTIIDKHQEFPHYNFENGDIKLPDELLVEYVDDEKNLGKLEYDMKNVIGICRNILINERIYV